MLMLSYITVACLFCLLVLLSLSAYTYVLVCSFWRCCLFLSLFVFGHFAHCNFCCYIIFAPRVPHSTLCMWFFLLYSFRIWSLVNMIPPPVLISAFLHDATKLFSQLLRLLFLLCFGRQLNVSVLRVMDVIFLAVFTRILLANDHQ